MFSVAVPIRAELGGLKGGFIPRETQVQLYQKVDSKDFTDSVYQSIETHIRQHVSKKKVKEVIKAQKRILEEEWRNPERILQIAPGADVLQRVFKRYNANFHKDTDGKRIAQNMTQDDIPDEIKNLLKRIEGLS